MPARAPRAFAHLPDGAAMCYISGSARFGAASEIRQSAMSKPVIFTISATWDDEASVWSGHCPDNHPDIDPASLFLQITALREAEPAAV